MQQQELQWEKVDSLNVERVAYHEDSSTLAVKFNNGGLYTYIGVQPDDYHNLIGAESVVAMESTIITMAKQVSQDTTPPPVNETSGGGGGGAKQQRNLFVLVETFNYGGEQIGTRIVDMYHFGTRNWLQNHHWWAMHNGHVVETRTATDEEIGEYVEEQRLKLADKYSSPQQEAESVAA
ncbi:unnamed protein product [Sphagnum compactum]